ncbi:MAG: DUF3618 domain-containing protein [Erythrobacter sp.]|uniref:DUF3618 domain-containing protein n=1 Tax=Erythrobacter sp. TaxID=1042 RepID=UPI0025F26BF5|nr:DUF3618 domain-containing protein [Erythrobacter sp.]MCL9999250.1 DUF3618 domain-containing protein [Erythrobacter sp.]
MAVTTDQRSPDDIERDIRATQAEMNQTARQLEGEFSPRNIIDSLLDKAGQNGVDSRYLTDVARRNPIALGMIAIGGLWLVSDADARPSAMKLPMGSSNSKSRNRTGSDDGWHPEHRNYVEHMSRCERQPDEDDLAYRRRRDHSRASYLMMEQGHDEDEGSFRQRLDEATEKMRRQREQWGESAQTMVGNSRDRARHMMDDARGFYFGSPLLSGLAAAFVGAVAGSALPATRTEEEYVGSWGEQALDAAGAKARKAGEQVRQRKDDMLDRAEDSLAARSHQGGQQHDGQPERNDQSSQQNQQDERDQPSADDGGNDRAARFNEQV